MILSEHETIIGAWAETPSGPGWSNRLIWVCIYDGATGRHRVDALQPKEQSEEILSAFSMHVASSDALRVAVERLAVRETKPARRGRGGS